jgi:hypothetical protein
VKDEYFQLLSEQNIDEEQPHWHSVKANISEDPRYKAIESSHRRKELFKEYVQQFHQVLHGQRFSCSLSECFCISIINLMLKKHMVKNQQTFGIILRGIYFSD